MPQRTGIEWADFSTNPLKARDPKTNRTGWACARCSAGCANCYSATLNNRFGTGLDYTIQNVRAVTSLLDERELDRILRFRPKPPFKNGNDRAKVFPFDMTDLFGEWVPFELIDRVFAVFALRPDVDFMVLTKRPERMAEYLTAKRGEATEFSDEGDRDRSIDLTSYSAIFPHADHFRSLGHGYAGGAMIGIGWPLRNVWCGFSAEDQPNFDKRYPHIRPLAEAGWVTWCSAEPLIGPINLASQPQSLWAGTGLKLIVAGGESGHGARPMHPEWPRDIRDQCAAAGASFFFKQWGQWAPAPKGSAALKKYEAGGPKAGYFGADGAWKDWDRGGYAPFMASVGKKVAGRLLDGKEYSEFPAIHHISSKGG